MKHLQPMRRDMLFLLVIFRQTQVAQTIVDTLKWLDLHYSEVPTTDKTHCAEARKLLNSESDKLA